MRVEYLARTSLVGKRLPPLSLSFRPHDFQVWRAKSVNPLMICEDIWKIYRVGDVEVPALRGLSLTIEQGEFVAVMGSSGSGKSTLMNILGCLDQPTRGQYRLNGVEVGRLRPDRLAEIRNQQIGFVFQNFNLIPRTNALENAQLPLFYRGLSLKEQRALASAALQRVGLTGREQHFPTQLSGGQQQRVAIARALVASPSLLLADEPTGNLDTESSREIMGILEGLNRDGMTVILVTHEVDIAAYASREIVIKDGQILSDREIQRRSHVVGA
jgi:putative ABC transport system ATP-binding protein